MSQQSVWQFPIETADEFTVAMPFDAEILHVGVQDGQPFMWALVTPSDVARLRLFHVHGTGHPVTDGARYLGSFMLYEGRFVGHLFEDEATT